jgi:hypothetical protein
MNTLELINALKNEGMILTLPPQGRISIQLRCAIKKAYNPGRQTGCMRHHDYLAERPHEPRHIQDIGRQMLSK